MIGNSELAHDFWESGKSASCPIYDMHGHMGTWAAIFFPRGDAETMIGTMDECGVKMLIFSHHHALQAPNVGNRPSIEAVRRFHDGDMAGGLDQAQYLEASSQKVLAELERMARAGQEGQAAYCV